MIDKLQLNISLVNEINDWSNKYALSKNYIGLHIRYSDKKPTKRIDLLISFIQNNYGDHPIYLATDNKEIENVFRKEFSNLISYPKNIPDEVAGRGIHSGELIILMKNIKNKYVKRKYCRYVDVIQM